MSSSIGRRFRPGLEELEDRTTPAGNVTALVFDGVFYVGGDSAANHFEIRGAGSRSATIQPTDADTTVNGQSGELSFSGIRKGYHIVTGDGDDIVTLRGLNARDTINVDLGAGNDNLQMVRSSAGKGSIVQGGDGDDQLTMRNSSFGKLFAYIAGPGDDYFSATGNRFRGPALLNGGDGANTFAESGNNARRGLQMSGFTPGLPPSFEPTPAPTPTPTPDTTAPTATIATTATNPSISSAIPFSIAFSEETVGFDESDLAASNGTISNFTPVNTTTYTFNVTPAADGPVTVALAEGAAQDLAGNDSPATSQTIRSLRTDAGMTSTLPDVNSASFVPFGNAGLKVWNVQTGSGGMPVQAGSTITVFYTGWLTNGTVFDSARTTGSPATFPLANLIVGWQQGLLGMQPGDIRRLVVPPALAYGAGGHPPTIPGNATLIFEIKLLAVT